MGTGGGAGQKPVCVLHCCRPHAHTRAHLPNYTRNGCVIDSRHIAEAWHRSQNIAPVTSSYCGQQEVSKNFVSAGTFLVKLHQSDTRK